MKLFLWITLNLLNNFKKATITVIIVFLSIYIFHVIVETAQPNYFITEWKQNKQNTNDLWEQIKSDISSKNQYNEEKLHYFLYKTGQYTLQSIPLIIIIFSLTFIISTIKFFYSKY